MKTAFLFVAITTLMSASFTQAAECTSSELTSIASLPQFQKLSTACGTADFTSATTAEAATSAFCKSDCIAVVKELAKAVPKCETSNVSLSASYDAAVKVCSGASPSAPAPAGAPAAAQETTPQPAAAGSASAESTAVSAAVAFAAAAIALALL